MDGNRARALLCVRPHASTDEIRTAFRRAVRSAHPDGGGDAAVFRSLVAARDLLLATARPATARAWPSTEAPRSVLDLVDLARPRPVASPVEQPAGDFDAVLAAVLAA